MSSYQRRICSHPSCEPMCPAVHTRDTLPIVDSLLHPSPRRAAAPTLKLFQPWWSILGIFRKYRICAKLEWSCYLATFSPFSHCQSFASGTIFSGFVPIYAGRRELNWLMIIMIWTLYLVNQYRQKPTYHYRENIPLTTHEMSQTSYKSESVQYFMFISMCSHFTGWWTHLLIIINLNIVLSWIIWSVWYGGYGGTEQTIGNYSKSTSTSTLQYDNVIRDKVHIYSSKSFSGISVGRL